MGGEDGRAGAPAGAARRRLLVPATVVALLAGQAWLAAGDGPSPRPAVPGWASAVGVLLTAAMAGALVAILATALAAPHRRGITGAGRTARDAPLLVRALAIALPIAVLALFLGIAALERRSADGGRRIAPAPLDATHRRGLERARADEPQRVAAGWWWAAGGAAVAGVVATALLLRPGARRPGDRPARGRIAAAQAALDDAAVRLRAAPDARGGILEAYASMEETLAAIGLGRASSEAPREYLRRVEDAGGAAGAARTLTGLYEHARFDDGAVTEAMRTRAIAAVEEVRSALATAGGA